MNQVITEIMTHAFYIWCVFIVIVCLIAPLENKNTHE